MSEAGVPDWLLPLVRAVEASSAEDYLRIGAPVPPPDGRRSAVLILLGESPSGPDILLIERAERLRKHAGQPAFPGGAADPGDAGPVETALRESAEEVGLESDGVRVVTLLPELYLPPTRFLITPVLAWWHRPTPVGVVDPGEVARVERVPVAELVDPANRCRVRGPSGHAGPAFTVRGMLVWGFTAAVLDRVLELAGWARPWDPDDIRELPRRARNLAVRGMPGYPGPGGAPVAPADVDPAGSDEGPADSADGLADSADGLADSADGLADSADGLADPDDGPAAEDVLPADEHGDGRPPSTGTVER